jgi:RimJ/RimL family protein N-acetyltransferase
VGGGGHAGSAGGAGGNALRGINRERRAELGYWLAAATWGHGIATEAVRALVDFGFRELALARIFAHVLDGNAASMRVLEKLGLEREGLLRQHLRKGRRLRDVVVYGARCEDWGLGEA